MTTADDSRATLDELCRLIHGTFGIDPAIIDPERSVLEAGLDSLALTELLFEVEDRFHVDLSDLEGNVTTLKALAAIIDQKRLNGAARRARPQPSAAE
jgi:acyl carrier protein